jgi:hypothetical protein
MIIVGYSRQATVAAGSAPRVIGTRGAEVPTSSPAPLAIALPTGGGAIAEGDMVLVALFCDQSLTIAGGVTAGQGYADLVPRTVSSSPGCQISYKFMGPTPDAQVNVDVNPGRAEAVLIAVIRGVDRAAPLDGNVQSGTGGSGAMPNPPGCTTQAANTLRVIVGGCDDASAIAATAPAGFADLVQSATTAASAAGCMAFRQAASAGALDPDSFGGTATGSSATVAFHFALRAAA